MMTSEPSSTDLRRWLAPFLVKLAHPAQRAMCQLYVAGLISPGQRKSVQPMAHRLGQANHDGLHHFVSVGLWDAAALEVELIAQADRMVGGRDAILVIGQLALTKKGSHSVGVAIQPAPPFGRRINCQILVSLTLVGGGHAIPVALRLFLPEPWAVDRFRLDKAGVPLDGRQGGETFQIALALVDRIIAAGVRFGDVVIEAGCGHQNAFRRGLDARGLSWMLGVPPSEPMFPPRSDCAATVPSRYRDERLKAPAARAQDAATLLNDSHMKSSGNRRGGGGARASNHSACRARMGSELMSALPERGTEENFGGEVWLIGDRQGADSQRFYVSNRSAGTPMRRLFSIIEALRLCERENGRLIDEFGLAHFEGRSWRGLHRHALMTLLAHAYMQRHHVSSGHFEEERVIAI